MSLLLNVIKGNRISETIENYPIAFDTNLNATENKLSDYEIYDERQFWRQVMTNPEKYWDMKFNIYKAIFTYWVPRVPGILYTPAAETMRAFAETLPYDDQTQYGDVRHVLKPMGKSIMVSGGMGTLKLPADSSYSMIGCLSFSGNASGGIPVLITDEVKAHHNLKDGCGLKITGARWRQMSIEWASKFLIAGGIPRGYLVIDHPAMITKTKDNYGVLIQPFTIMEQEAANGYLYDFVYVTVNAADKEHKSQSITFFDQYRSSEKHRGEYLLAIDPANPYFDAKYILPKDLEEKDTYGNSQMKLMKERIKGSSFNGVTIDKLATVIPQHYDKADDIYRLAQNIGIAKSSIPDDATSKMTIVLLEKAIAADRISVLVEQIVAEFPETLNT